VHISRPGNDVVKTANELKVDEKVDGSTSNGVSSEKKEDDKEGGKQEEEKAEKEKDKGEEEARAGDKRKAEEKADVDEKDAEKTGQDVAEIKKQKTTNGKAAPAPEVANGEVKEKKKPGRPKGSGNGDKKGANKEKKVPTVGVAQRKTRSQSKVE